jgi:hypothetical protein
VQALSPDSHIFEDLPAAIQVYVEVVLPVQYTTVVGTRGSLEEIEREAGNQETVV